MFSGNASDLFYILKDSIRFNKIRLNFIVITCMNTE